MADIPIPPIPPRRAPLIDIMRELEVRPRARQSQEFDPVAAMAAERRSQSRQPLPLPPIPPAVAPPRTAGDSAEAGPPRDLSSVSPTIRDRLPENNPYVAAAIDIAEKYNLPRDVFLSLVHQESRFDPKAKSPRGAFGLTQLMPGTARDLGVDPRDPMANLDAGARYLRQQIDRFGSLPLALAAYNSGPGRVIKSGNQIPNIRETQNYVSDILRNAGMEGTATDQRYGFAEGGLADLDEKYAEGGRVGRVVGAVRRAVTREAPEATTLQRGVNPSNLIFREPVQNRLDEVANMFPEGGGYPPIVAAQTDDGLLILDGHNRVRVAQQRNETIDAVVIPESVYRQALSKGLDEVDLSHAALELAGEGDAASAIRQQFRGTNWEKSEADARQFFDRYEDARQQTPSLEDLDRKYAEGGAVSDEDAEYDSRLLSRMKAQMGRASEPTRAEQMQALRTAGRSAAEGLADVLLPQSPLDVALMVALGPGGRAARLAGSAALASLEPSEAEASRLRRLIRAYHGSPHKFEEFDIRKIGTGEGAQAYGRGLYFAENEDVARDYRNKLSKSTIETASGRLHPYSSSAADEIAGDLMVGANPQVRYPAEDAIGSMVRGQSLDTAIAQMRRNYDHLDPANLDEAERLLRQNNPRVISSGHMYEVNLNAAPRDFLNWDAPLSQQSREVQDSLQRFGLRADPDAARAYDDALLDALYNDPGRALPPQPRDPTGQEIYQRHLRMTPEEARVALMEVGVPGTRYLDAGSRGVGGTYNYAVFDPEIIDITRRYAEGGLADLDEKYAEGGRVRRPAAAPVASPFDADYIERLAAQAVGAGEPVAELRSSEGRGFAPMPRSFGEAGERMSAVIRGDVEPTPEEERQMNVVRGFTEGPAIISPATARAIQMETRLPQDKKFLQAVENTPGARISDEGLALELLRYQKPEQAGAQAIREGVFYLPATLPSRSVGTYKAELFNPRPPSYGGTERVRGETLLRAPLAVPGKTGGNVPFTAYLELGGDEMALRVPREIDRTFSWSPSYNKIPSPASYRAVEDWLAARGGNPEMATDIVNNSLIGDQLFWAMRENVIGNKARQAGYDSIVGTGARKPRISEVFDLREAAYPVPGRPEFEMLVPYFDDLTRGYAEGGLAALDQKYADGGTVRAPKETTIAGQDHKLAYITDREAALLKARGGSGRMTEHGVRAYNEGPGGEGPGGQGPGGDPSDNANSMSESATQDAVGGNQGQGAGPTGAGAGSGPPGGPDSNPNEDAGTETSVTAPTTAPTTGALGQFGAATGLGVVGGLAGFGIGVPGLGTAAAGFGAALDAAKANEQLGMMGLNQTVDRDSAVANAVSMGAFGQSVANQFGQALGFDALAEAPMSAFSTPDPLGDIAASQMDSGGSQYEQTEYGTPGLSNIATSMAPATAAPLVDWNQIQREASAMNMSVSDYLAMKWRSPAAMARGGMASLEQMHAKYAEGGPVVSVYDPDEINDLANQILEGAYV